jgi:cytochrome c biogenesis protein CcdA
VISAGFGLAFVASVLSILSPCVLPLLPIVFGTAASEHRFGPLFLAGGVAASFVAIGLFVGTIGFGIGLDGSVFRTGAAMVMIFVGVVLASRTLQVRLAALGGPLSNRLDAKFGGSSLVGPSGQFVVGLLLGAVWSRCVGPTPGAASVLATRGENLGQVGLIMAAFGGGAALPLVALGAMSRRMTARWRDKLLVAGKGMKTALGVVLVAGGFMAVTGVDKDIEAFILSASPEWLTALTTRY